MGKSIIECAIELLKTNGKPMSIKELTYQIEDRIIINSKTPEKTVSSALQRSKNAIRVERGVYKYVKYKN